MNVIVKYPDTFPLTGYQLALFDWTLRKLLSNDSFYFFRLTKLAKQACVDLKAEGPKSIYEDLEQLEWDKIEKLPPTLKTALPAKIGELLGVTIKRTPVRAASLKKGILGAVALAVVPTALVIWSHGFAVREPKHVYSQSFAPSRSLSSSMPVTDNTPMLIAAADRVLAHRYMEPAEPAETSTDGEFIVDSSVVSRTPSAQAARAVSMATLMPGAAYRVHVTVQPVAQPVRAKRE